MIVIRDGAERKRVFGDRLPVWQVAVEYAADKRLPRQITTATYRLSYDAIIEIFDRLYGRRVTSVPEQCAFADNDGLRKAFSAMIGCPCGTSDVRSMSFRLVNRSELNINKNDEREER